MIVSEAVKDMIQNALDQDYNNANRAFGDVMTIKLNDLLDQEKVKLADTIYNGAENEEDDPDEEQLELDLETEDELESEDEDDEEDDEVEDNEEDMSDDEYDALLDEVEDD